VGFCKTVDQIVKSRQKDYERVYNFVENMVKKIRYDATVDIYGSCATNLALPYDDSDLDLVVTLPNPEGLFTRNSFQDNLSFLPTLYEALRQEPWVTQVQYIDTASVPVIKLHTSDDIPIDITMSQPSHSGKKTKTLLLQFLQDYKELRYLVIVLKQFLRQQGLHNPYTGGLGSYCLCLMVTSFLQIYVYRKKESKGIKNLGKLLMDLLQLYGKFEFERIVIKVTEEGGHIPLPIPTHYHLLVMDPCIPTRRMISPHNNIGNSAFMIHKVKEAFNRAASSPHSLIPTLIAGINNETHAHLKG